MASPAKRIVVFIAEKDLVCSTTRFQRGAATKSVVFTRKKHHHIPLPICKLLVHIPMLANHKPNAEVRLRTDPRVPNRERAELCAEPRELPLSRDAPLSPSRDNRSRAFPCWAMPSCCRRVGANSMRQ
jgi:hypothetical protein